MRMEDHHQYGISDLHIINGRAHFQSMGPSSAGELLLPTSHHYEMLMAGGHHHAGGQEMIQQDQFAPEHCITGVAGAPAASAAAGGLDMELGCLGGDMGGTGRWPRQETLTLLEIRSQLDHKFKEANQKGPLWDEVSRIMSEEHGYQRSGKKCREKFENLYKYYKKTRDRKSGRQDGKHYRFFRQLEALCGSDPASFPSSNNIGTQSMATLVSPAAAGRAAVNDGLPTQKHSSSFSLSNSSEFETSSTSDDNDSKKKRRGWKVISDVIEKQMQRLVDKQEAWLEKMLATLERKEQERVRREEDWRRQEALRIDREHRFWANERAWVKARDAALMEALQKLTGSNNGLSAQYHDGTRGDNKETIVDNSSDAGKRRRDSSNSGLCYFPTGGEVFSFSGGGGGQQGGGGYCDQNDDVSVLPSSSSGPVVGDAAGGGAFRFLMGDGDVLWENYAAKLGAKGDS